MSETFHPVTAAADFPEAGSYAIVINGWHVLIARGDDGLVAMNDRCTHAASPLSTGRIRRGAVMCPLHGARFDLASGKCIGGAYPNLRHFPVQVRDGMIEVAVPAVPPGIEDLPNTP